MRMGMGRAVGRGRRWIRVSRTFSGLREEDAWIWDMGCLGLWVAWAGLGWGATIPFCTFLAFLARFGKRERDVRLEWSLYE